MTTSVCNERVKSSDTSTSIATTGVGLRIDPPPAEWFLAKVTAATTSGGFNVYSLEEVEPVTTTYGYQTKSGGFTTSYAAELNNATVAVNTIVFARFRCYHSTTGDTYEFVHVEAAAAVVHNTFAAGSGNLSTGTLPDWAWPESWDQGNGTFLPTVSVSPITVATGKRVKGLCIFKTSVGPGSPQYGSPSLAGVTSQNITASITASGMTNNISGSIAGATQSAFALNSQQFEGLPAASFSLITKALPVRFDFTNSSGSNQDITFSVSGFGVSGYSWYWGTISYSPAFIVVGYYVTEDA